ncbi:ATP-binding protein [Cohnella rhizosphaerae]|uniref:ATP-binding protein n=1 Tax=Cohnella rhizosphaerae TaxID=1457232 RepID=A0A9X4KWN2_9BACL|nr:ATP-binding protein [Cohnella rhizosphaerae]MDG0809347.1 ATP-binding protein [Cohnella rhizosphaerae]
MGDAELLREWIVPSELGQEAELLRELSETLGRDDRLRIRREEIVTAVAEACLNAIEHGNGCDRELPVTVTMWARRGGCVFRVADCGAGTILATGEPPLQAADKLDWEQPRGWGLRFMREYADELRAYRLENGFCVELAFAGRGGEEEST